MGSNPGLAIFFLFFYPTRGKKWVLAGPNFRERTTRVKLELTDFRRMFENYIVLSYDGRMKRKQIPLF